MYRWHHLNADASHPGSSDRWMKRIWNRSSFDSRSLWHSSYDGSVEDDKTSGRYHRMPTATNRLFVALAHV